MRVVENLKTLECYGDTLADLEKRTHTQRNMINYPNISEKLGLGTAQNGPPKGLSVGLHDS